MKINRKRIVNNPEEKTQATVKPICEKYGAHLYTKLRTADVLPIDNSGIPNELFTYALKSHFDFIVADSENEALFAIEFDGPTHTFNSDTKRRDDHKERLCKRFHLPLVRIGSDFLKEAGPWTIIGWMTEIWFLSTGFYAAQDRGDVPMDEIFTPAFIFGGPEMQLGYYDPLLVSRDKIRRFSEKGICISYVPAEFCVIDREEFVHAMAVIEMKDGYFVVGRSRFKHFHFEGISANELAIDLAVTDAAEKMERPAHTITAATVKKWAKQMEKLGRLRTSGSFTASLAKEFSDTDIGKSYLDANGIMQPGNPPS